ncbi:MAG: hypothetical protein IMZ53_01830 [Thermoplasmata archaeon]|nr:hypothetical protein [Thermoplasmata archaeon]
MNKPEDYFEIDETENLIDNLEMVTHFLEASIPYKWKWALIALYQALYGALISTLQGTDPRQTVVDRQKDSGKAVMLHVNRVPIDIIASSFGKDQDTIRDWISNPYLISLDEALRRVKQKEFLPSLSNAQPLSTTAEEDAAIRRLTKEFRNEFEHFAPKGWVVYTSIFPPIVTSVLRVIRFLEFESNCVNMSVEQEQRVNTGLAKIEQLLRQ